MSVLDTGSLLDSLAIYPAIREPFTGTSPAAGADFTLALDGKFTTRLVSLHCRLVTNASVANREVVLEYRNDQDLRFALMGAPVTWPASTTVDYEFNILQRQAEWPVDSSVLVPAFPMFLPGGWNLRIHVVSMNAADQLSAIRGTWERYYTDGAH